MKIDNLKQRLTAASFGRRLAAATILAGGVTAVAPVAVAQDFTTGVLSGVVTDADGAPVGGATVTAQSNAQGFTRSTTSSADGSYRVPRLAVGDYTVTISKDGFQDTVNSEVDIATIGGAYNFVMFAEGVAVQETIVITGQAGLTTDEFAATTGGISVDVEELLTRTPIQRDLTAVQLLAPGTTQGDSAFGNLASFSGSSVGENVYYVNGMNVSNFRNFTDFTSVPFEAVSSIDVKTGGYQAEFGRSTGGVVNVVTKSGSNDFHFGGNVFWEPDALREAPPNTYSAFNEDDETDVLDYNIYASGPIWKDRIFFYALYNPYKEEQFDAYTLAQEADFLEEDSAFWFGKVDFNIIDGHRLEITGFSDQAERITGTYDWDPDTQTVGDFTGTTIAKRGGETYSGRYTGAFTDWLTVSALYGETTYDRTTQSDLDANPVVYDNRNATGGAFVPLGNWVNFLTDSGEDKREMFRVDVDIFAKFMGEHNIRVGYDQEKLTANALTTLSGGAYYLYRNDNSGDITGIPGSEYVRVRDYRVGGDFETEQSAFYIQDSWSITDELTVQLGLRNETFTNYDVTGAVFAEQDNQLQPRIGVTYDMFADGRSKLFGFFGRYSLPVATNTNIRLAGGETYIHTYWDFDGTDPATDAPNLTTQYDRVDVLSDGSVPDAIELVSENLDPFYANEFILGYEKILGEDWTVSARGIYRELDSIIEDVAVDAGVLKWCDDNGITGCEDVWSGFHHYVLINPGSDLIYYTDDLPGAAEGEFTKIEVPAADLGYPEATREYKAIELKVDKPFNGTYGFNASYTWSTIRGNYEGAVKSDLGQDDAGLTVDFDQPGFVDGSYGPSPNERKHTFKFFGSYALTEDVVLGVNAIVQSPRKYGCLGHHPTDAFALLYGADSWYCIPGDYSASGDPDGDWRTDSVLTPRGSQLESDWRTQIDVGVKWNVPISFGEFQLSADVYNIFNSKAAVDLQETGELGQGTPSPYYGEPTLYQSPRYMRLGATFRY